MCTAFSQQTSGSASDQVLLSYDSKFPQCLFLSFLFLLLTGCQLSCVSEDIKRHVGCLVHSGVSNAAGTSLAACWGRHTCSVSPLNHPFSMFDAQNPSLRKMYPCKYFINHLGYHLCDTRTGVKESQQGQPWEMLFPLS